jgi:hypothetical protein
MNNFRVPLRWTALTGLGILACFLGFLTAIQALMVVLPPGAAWQKPRLYKVTVKSFDPDPRSEYTAVFVTDEQEKERVLTLLKEERMALEVDEEIWVLDAPFRSRLRPPQYRVTPLRLVLEFPAPWLVLTLLVMWRVRRTQVRITREEQEAPRERTVVRDEFHARAQRFAPPKDEG